MNTMMKETMRGITDMCCRVTWGSPSPETWRRECEESLTQAHKRRSKHGRSATAEVSLFILYVSICLVVAYVLFRLIVHIGQV